jgi:peptide/nickel transport system substrate-binding protein
MQRLSKDETGKIIEQIRSTETSEDRLELYKELQEVIYEEQPVIFLYVPVERIVSRNRVILEPSSRRPGYFVNLIRPAES